MPFLTGGEAGDAADDEALLAALRAGGGPFAERGPRGGRQRRRHPQAHVAGGQRTDPQRRPLKGKPGVLFTGAMESLAWNGLVFGLLEGGGHLGRLLDCDLCI